VHCEGRGDERGINVIPEVKNLLGKRGKKSADKAARVKKTGHQAKRLVRELRSVTTEACVCKITKNEMQS